MAHCRVSSELFEAQSQILALQKAVEDERGASVKVKGKLSAACKDLRRVTAQKAQLETDMQVLYQNVEGVLGGYPTDLYSDAYTAYLAPQPAQQGTPKGPKGILQGGNSQQSAS